MEKYYFASFNSLKKKKLRFNIHVLQFKYFYFNKVKYTIFAHNIYHEKYFCAVNP